MYSVLKIEKLYTFLLKKIRKNVLLHNRIRHRIFWNLKPQKKKKMQVFWFTKKGWKKSFWVFKKKYPSPNLFFFFAKIHHFLKKIINKHFLFLFLFECIFSFLCEDTIWCNVDGVTRIFVNIVKSEKDLEKPVFLIISQIIFFFWQRNGRGSLVKQGLGWGLYKRGRLRKIGFSTH